MPSAPGRGAAHGFSLLDLVVVFTIIGILAAIAIPRYVEHRDKTRQAAMRPTAHYVLVAAADYADAGLIIEPYHSALGSSREGCYTNPCSGKRDVLNTSVFFTNEPRYRWASFDSATNGSFRSLLAGTVIARWNNAHAVRAIEVHYADGDGMRSPTVARVPFD